MVKNPSTMEEIPVWLLGQEDPLEKGTATHSSILAWRILWTEEPGSLQPMGSQGVRHNWATFMEITMIIYVWLAISQGLQSAFACIICSELSWQSDAELTEKQRRMRKTGQKIIKIDCCCFSVTKSGWTVCNPTDCRMPGFPVQSLLKFMSIESTEHIAGKCGYSVILTNQSVLFLHLHVKFKVINYEWGETALWGQKGQYQEVKEHEWHKRCSERPRATWGSFGVGSKPLYSWKPSVESQYYSRHD